MTTERNTPMFDAELTQADLTEIGAAFVRLVTISVMMGHVSPAGSLVYVDPDGGDPWQRFVTDAFCACTPRGLDAAERLVRWVNETPAGRATARKIAAAVML